MHRPLPISSPKHSAAGDVRSDEIDIGGRKTPSPRLSSREKFFRIGRSRRWRRGELNPRPEAVDLGVYVRSLVL